MKQHDFLYNDHEQLPRFSTTHYSKGVCEEVYENILIFKNVQQAIDFTIDANRFAQVLTARNFKYF